MTPEAIISHHASSQISGCCYLMYYQPIINFHLIHDLIVEDVSCTNVPCTNVPCICNKIWFDIRGDGRSSNGSHL